MTEVEASTMEAAQEAPAAADVDMQSATELTTHTEEVSAQEFEGASAADVGAASDPQGASSADTSAEEPTEKASKTNDDGASSDVAPTVGGNMESQDDGTDVTEGEAVAASNGATDVKMEDEEPATAPAKRKEPESSDAEAPSATVEANNGVADGAVVEPAAKKLKVDEPASPATTGTVTEAASSATSSTDSHAVPSASATTTTPAAAPVSAVHSAPLMISRDDMAKMEEDGGMLKFDVITNDGQPEHMMQLTTLKNIFARQLPKMPREYIVRLVFDRNHRSMIILKNGKTVIGGICYRPFEPNHFAEIAFCAINAADQVKGYGTRLMNHLKEYVKASGITHFLTYADNYAIGYFKKQGFAKVVSMPRWNWFGYIKDYDGGTLMECTIHHQINYLRITSMVQEQRKKIQVKVKERSRADVVYPGLTQFAEGRTMDLYMIPGVKEAGWSHAVIRNSRVGTRDPGSLKTQLQQLWKAVSSHRSAWPFHEPVDTSIVVDYLDYIKEPVDLSLIQKRIESGHYISKAKFKEDLDRMCANCMVYNTPDTNYYKAAKDLQDFVDKRVQVAK